MDGVWGDVRFAVRTLVRAPSFTLVAVVTLGLGIGANTAIFSVVDGVLLSALPYDEPEELVSVWLDMSERDGPEREWLTPPDFQDFRDEPGLFEGMGGWGGWGPTLTGLGEPAVLTAARVTEGTFERVLHMQPFLGRGFLAEEDRPGAAGAVVLSYEFWRDRFGADRGALGRPVILDEQPYSVVGVMPEGFAPPFVPAAELWTTARLDPDDCGRGCFAIRAIARLAPGVSLDAARERANALADRLAAAYPDTNSDVGAALFGLRDDLVGPAARALWVLLGAVGFVLLIACTNVANLLLSRGAGREAEFAVRIALGAGRAPILRQLLTESVLLATLGGLLGLALAAWGTAALVDMAPVFLPGLAQVSLDGRILALTALVTLGTGILFGLVPALRASRTDVYAGVAKTRTDGGFGSRLRGGLVATQIALAMVLLVGAGLLIRSFDQLNSVELGFEPEGVLTVRVALPASRFGDAPARVQFFDELLDRLENVPGVVSVGATNALPLAGNDQDVDFRIEGQAPPRPPEANVAWIRPITGGYFYTMEQSLLEGREFDASDDTDAPRVVIINERLATRYFDYPRRSPIGQGVATGSRGEPVWRTIVGVAADTRHFGIRDGTRPAMYFPYGQVTFPAMTIVARTDGDPTALVPNVREAVSSIDPALAASAMVPMTERVASALVTERFVTNLLSAFAVLALILATVGLYGVVSYGVTRRTREIGIRLALGAGGGDVQRLVVRGGLRLTAIGVATGTVGALALTGVLEAILYDVSVTDPLTFGVMIGALAVVATLASWLPARRASGADPVSILREE
jgi:putative ABC transport system permease protein